MKPIIEILPDREALIARTAELMVDQIRDAIAARGRCSIALSGGSTPKPLYQKLAQADLPWQQLVILWGDERYVPHDHADSNARMAHEAWLNQVPIPPEQILPMSTGSDNPSQDAARYEQTLRQLFDQPAGIPAVDIILLGMGDDGHTASLFPQTEALTVRDRLITVGNHDGDPRITFTVPLINRGRHVLFLVSGANKQDALSHVFGDADAQHYPSKLVQPQGELRWLLDQAAGEGIPAGMR